MKVFQINCQKRFTKLQKSKKYAIRNKSDKNWKKTWNNNFTHNFKPQEVKMKNKVLREKSNCCLLIK